MASHFKWYPSDDAMTIPWNARYAFPSQSNKAEKLTPRIPPKSGSAFGPGQTIRLEFPAQGYVNPGATTLEFDVTLYGYYGAPAGQSVRFQNNIQSLFSRVRLLYGSTPLEDIISYNHIVRALTEWTTTNAATLDQTSINEGIGGAVLDISSVNNPPIFGLVNARQKYIQGITTGGSLAAPSPTNFIAGKLSSVGTNNVPSGVTGNFGDQTSCTRRYQVQLNLGLLNQDKLIPTKWMASQLAIEITLEQAAGCIFAPTQNVNPVGTIYQTGITGNPTYGVGNINLIPEILQFDSSYGNNIKIKYRHHVLARTQKRWSASKVFFRAHNHFLFIER